MKRFKGAMVLAGMACAFATWAAELPMPQVQQREPQSVRGADLPIKLAVKPLTVDMMPGDQLGHVSLGFFCINEQNRTVTEEFVKGYGTYAATTMAQELKRLGYPLANMGKSNAFDTDVSAAPDFRIGGIIRDVKFETCAIANNTKGWVYFKISWALFSEREQKVVLERTTEGLAKTDERVTDIMKRGLLANINNFLADPALLEQLKAAPAAKPTTPGGADTTTGKATGLNVADLKAQPPLKGGAQKNQAQLMNAVVTLETPTGTGSGFFIHKDGYLLTDYHVIAGAKFAKIKLANGDKLVGEVVKVNEHDDVALLKTPPIDFTPLTLRFDTAEVGEPVFAVGSPLGVLSNTMTKGVLSADRKIQGVHVLQSDAAVTFGSSGGPLLDADGRVIGLTKSTLAVSQGFNLFIPIVDALQSLEVLPK